jgi:hypothetical protein
MSSRLYLLGMTLALTFVIGCSQKTSVSGKVTYNGEPVEKGMISFKPSGGTGRSFGAPIENGAYEVSEALPGAWTAVIVGVKKINFAMSSEEAARKANENKSASGALAGHVSEAADYIPEDAEGNSKTVEITAGSQTMDFDVKGPPRT